MEEKIEMNATEQILNMKIDECEHHVKFLMLSNEIGRRAASIGHHPFGAVLVAPDGETVLATQCNVSAVEHAESTLARHAAENYSSDYLSECTLYTAIEPCAMCAGTIYWANIGCVVYGMEERWLLSMTIGNDENPTLDVPCRDIFSRGQKKIKVIGPMQHGKLKEEVALLHKNFWRT